MITVFEALIWGVKKLEETECEKKTDAHRPQLDAELLLSSVVDKPRSWIFANNDSDLSNDDFERFRKLIRRRACHEPVSQILNEVFFMGRRFEVNRHVLTPRPETEELVQMAAAEKAERYLDVGTGSGVIAISLALETAAEVMASDIDSLSLSVAKKNAKNLQAAVDFKQGSLLEPWAKEDLSNTVIVANLPYIPKTDLNSLDPDVRNYEPYKALFSGHDGADLYVNLFKAMKNVKFKVAYFEIDSSHAEELKALAEKILNRGAQIKNDLSGRSRFLIIH